MPSFNPSAPPTKTRELIPEGLYPARCSRIIDLGLQPGYEDKPPAPKAVIAFNLTTQFIEISGESKQKMISNAFGITLSNNEKSTMYQYTKALNPNAKELGDFLNCPCMINIVHYKKKDGSVGDKIDAVTRPMAGLVIDPVDIQAWWFRFDKPDLALWESIPDFQKEIIREAKDFVSSGLAAYLGEDDTVSDIPF